MTVREAISLIAVKGIVMGDMNREICGGFVSDIMSRAMEKGFSGMAWITQRADVNALAVAVMKGAACMIFPAGIEPEQRTMKKAEEEKMTLILSGETAFALSGKLYAAGLCGGEE